MQGRNQKLLEVCGSELSVLIFFLQSYLASQIYYRVHGELDLIKSEVLPEVKQKTGVRK